MSSTVDLDASVEEVHSIKDIDTASDYELKHTPNVKVVESPKGFVIKVTIGLKGIAHPQTAEHLIEWIRVFDGAELICDMSFGPDDTPRTELEVAQINDQIIVRSFCNLHGVWEACV